MASLVVLLSPWPISLLFGWLSSNNQVFSQCRLTGLSDPKTSRKQMSENQARTGYFVCIQLNTWHGCFHVNHLLSKYFYCPPWPLRSREAQKACGACGPGVFGSPPSARSAEDSQNSLRCSTRKQLGEELAFLCPSPQQLSHLLTLGDTAVHFQGSLLYSPVNSLIPHEIIEHLLSARS